MSHRGWSEPFLRVLGVAAREASQGLIWGTQNPRTQCQIWQIKIQDAHPVNFEFQINEKFYSISKYVPGILWDTLSM